MNPNLEYEPQLQKFINDIIIYKAVEFSAFSILVFKVGVQSYSTLGHSTLGHSVLGPYSALGPI
jgi:hypothetical protein